MKFIVTIECDKKPPHEVAEILRHLASKLDAMPDRLPDLLDIYDPNWDRVCHAATRPIASFAESG